MAHPEDWGLLAQRQDVNGLPDETREVVQLVVRDGGTVVWNSNEMALAGLSSFEYSTRVYLRPSHKLSVFLAYHRQFPTPTRVVLIRVRGVYFLPPNKRGEVNVTVRGSDPQFRSAVQSARRATIHSSRSPWMPRGKSFRLLVPSVTSPVIIFGGYKSVIENYDGPTAGYTLSIGSTNEIIKYREWTPNPTPGFGKLKKSQLPVNNYSCTIRLTMENHDFNHSFVPSNGSYHTEIHSWRTNLPGPNLPSHIPTARNMAIRKVIQEANLDISANLAQDAAQVTQLTELVAVTCNRFIGSITNLRRGNFAGAINHLTAGRTRLTKIPKGTPSRKKDLAENWLELQYGWKPLLMDIEGVMESLQNLNVGSPTLRRVVGRGKAVESVNSTFDTYTSPTIGPGKGIERRRTVTNARIGVVFSMESPMLSFLAQTGFTNPLNLAWEILPFSFVADWMIGIGPYLEALSAWDGLTFHTGYQTQFTKMWTDMSVDYDGINVGNNAGFWTQKSGLKLEDVKFDRLKLGDFPSQTFPRFKNPFHSVVHAWNAIALLGTFFRR